MYAHTASSEPSARWAAKWAIWGLNAQTRSAVASTIVKQKRSIASGRPSSGAGIRIGSGSRPTHSIDPDDDHAAASLALKLTAATSTSRLGRPVAVGFGGFRRRVAA